MLKHEKVFKQEDGSRMKVVVSFFSLTSSRTPRYEVDVYLCEPGKRTWSSVVNSSSYHFNRMSVEDQHRAKLAKCREVAGDERVAEVAKELWQLMTPQLNGNFIGG